MSFYFKSNEFRCALVDGLDLGGIFRNTLLLWEEMRAKCYQQATKTATRKVSDAEPSRNKKIKVALCREGRHATDSSEVDWMAITIWWEVALTVINVI